MSKSESNKSTAPATTPWHRADPARRASFTDRRALRHRVFVALARRWTGGRLWRVFEAMSYSGRLMRPFIMLNARVMPFGKLPRRDTELVILRIAWLTGSRYEYGQHAGLGRRHGLTDLEFSAIREGPGVSGLSPRVRALLAACDDLVERHMIADAQWRQLRTLLSDEQLVELCMLVGLYTGLAGMLNSTGVELEPRLERWVDVD